MRTGTNKNSFSPNTTAIIQTSNTKRERRPSKKLLSASAPATLTSNNLLGNFEESVLNGRLEPNSTVEGFTAEIGASGSFQPKHKTLPVTVFFYTLCDNAAYSSPYLGKKQSLIWLDLFRSGLVRLVFSQSAKHSQSLFSSIHSTTMRLIPLHI